MKPSALSPLGLYGNRDLFFEKIKEGYTQFAFGTGPEINAVRIVGMFVLFPPSESEKTIIVEGTTKDYNGYASVRCRLSGEYTTKEFENFIREKRVKLSKKMDLQELMSDWDEPGLDYNLLTRKED